MPRITRESLLPLEAYAKARHAFRARVIEHKRRRMLPLGEHVTLFFEDELTIRYQIQEMLRAERIFEEEDIQHELDVYNPLVPDGTNWKATMMIEYGDVAERQRMLARLVGIEDRVWIEVEGQPRVYAIADEDLERDTPEKTSAVHFLRFELTPAAIAALRAGAGFAAGVDHPAYRVRVERVSRELREALLADLAGG